MVEHGRPRSAFTTNEDCLELTTFDLFAFKQSEKRKTNIKQNAFLDILITAESDFDIKRTFTFCRRISWYSPYFGAVNLNNITSVNASRPHNLHKVQHSMMVFYNFNITAQSKKKKKT